MVDIFTRMSYMVVEGVNDKVYNLISTVNIPNAKMRKQDSY